MMYEPQVMMTPQLDSLRLGLPERRIGIYGGTFNPIHDGHIDTGLHVRQEFGLHSLMYLVDGDPPHKSGKELAPAEDRFRMVELAVMDRPGLWASDLELRRPGHTYTIDTMRILQAGDPDADFMYIIGEDTLHQLETWRDFAQLCRMTEFICVRRPGEYDKDPMEMIQQLGERYDAVIHMSHYTGPDISSTMIRARVRDGESIAGLVPPAVEEYIYAAGLYV